jgi:hypothetical protein
VRTESGFPARHARWRTLVVPFLLALREQTMTRHQAASGLQPSSEEREQRVRYRYECAHIIEHEGKAAGLFKVARDGLDWQLVQIQLAPALHVIPATNSSGLEGPMYRRASFPEPWARLHGKGRVFYTSMGHREDVWPNPQFADLVVNAMKWTGRVIDADVTPNLTQVTPKADVTPGDPATQKAK